jgi:hypothetical protein
MDMGVTGQKKFFCLIMFFSVDVMWVLLKTLNVMNKMEAGRGTREM